MTAVKAILCLLTIAVIAWFWKEALLLLIGLGGALVALAILDGLAALVVERPLLAAALFLLVREDGDKEDR